METEEKMEKLCPRSPITNNGNKIESVYMTRISEPKLFEAFLMVRLKSKKISVMWKMTKISSLKDLVIPFVGKGNSGGKNDRDQFV